MIHFYDTFVNALNSMDILTSHLIHLIFNDLEIFYELCIFRYELICEPIFMIAF